MTILELMVAVGLLAILMVALFAALNQTQRAFRTGLNQVDVLETGRATMDLISRGLQELTPSGRTNVVNLYIGPPDAPARVYPLSSGSWPAVLQEFYYLSRRNDQWIATKYSYEKTEWGSGVATLYRRTIILPWYAVQTLSTNSMIIDPAGVGGLVSTNYHRVAEGVVDLRLRAYNAQGYPVPNDPARGVRVVLGPSGFESYRFVGTNVPAYVDIELAVLDAGTLQGYRARLSVPSLAQNYLTNRLGHVHLFRERVPIRSQAFAAP